MAVGSVNAIPHLTVDLHQDMEWNIRTTLVRRSGCDLAKESLAWMKCSLSKYSSNSELFHQPTLMHNFLYLLTICMLHYYPRHVSGINVPIFRRKNCIHTASSIYALELSEWSYINIRSTVLFPPEDGHVNARNLSRIIVWHTYC